MSWRRDSARARTPQRGPRTHDDEVRPPLRAHRIECPDVARGGINLLAGRAIVRTMNRFMVAEPGSAFDLAAALALGTLPTVLSAVDSALAVAAYASLSVAQEVCAEGLARDVGGSSRFLEAAAFTRAATLHVSEVARGCETSRSTVSGYPELLADLRLYSASRSSDGGRDGAWWHIPGSSTSTAACSGACAPRDLSIDPTRPPVRLLRGWSRSTCARGCTSGAPGRVPRSIPFSAGHLASGESTS